MSSDDQRAAPSRRALLGSGAALGILGAAGGVLGTVVPTVASLAREVKDVPGTGELVARLWNEYEQAKRMNP